MKSVRLGDVLEKTSTIKWSSQPNDRTYSYIDLTSVDRDKHEITQTIKINAKNAPSRAQKITKTGDVLFGTTRPTLNRLCLVPELYNGQICSTGLCVLRADREKVIPDYIYYLLSTERFLEYVKTIQRGTSYPAITDSDVKNFEFTLPILEDQMKAVQRLDDTFEKIDRVVALTEKNIQKKYELKESVLSHILGGPAKSRELGDIFDFKNGRAFKKTEWKNNGLPIIRIQNLNDKMAGYNYFQGDYDKNIEVNGGDLLFSWSGTVGSSFGPHLWNRERGVLNQHIFKLKPKYDIDVSFAFYALLDITSEIEKQTHGAGGLVHITKKKLERFTIPDLPLQDQKGVSIYLDEFMAKTNRIHTLQLKKLKELMHLKQSLLAQAFFPGEVE